MNGRQKLILVGVMGLASVALWAASSLAGGARRNSFCQTNLKQIGLALKIYERDYDEKTTLSKDWKTVLWPYRNVGKPGVSRDEIFDCPSLGVNYALNRHMSGASPQQIPDYTGTPTVFDSTSNHHNAADFGTSYVSNGAHAIWRRGRGTNVLFFDGHVKWMQQKPVFRAVESPSLPKPPKKPAKTRAAR